MGENDSAGSIGSSLDDFLIEEGILEQVAIAATQNLINLELADLPENLKTGVGSSALKPINCDMTEPTKPGKR